MKIIDTQKFEDLEFKSDEIIENISFEKCEFNNIILSFRPDDVPVNRTNLKNCIFKDCIIDGRTSSQDKIYLENVVFDNIKIPNDLLRLNGTIFNKVTLKGNFDRILLNSGHFGMVYVNKNESIEHIDESQLNSLNQYVEDEYKNSDWALDISQGEFRECEIHNVPAHLVKRNPETQILIRYEKVKNSNWENNNKIQNSYAKYFCGRVMKTENDRVFIAPVRNKKQFVIEMEAIKILREEGIADLD